MWWRRSVQSRHGRTRGRAEWEVRVRPSVSVHASPAGVSVIPPAGDVEKTETCHGVDDEDPEVSSDMVKACPGACEGSVRAYLPQLDGVPRLPPGAAPEHLQELSGLSVGEAQVPVPSLSFLHQESGVDETVEVLAHGRCRDADGRGELSRGPCASIHQRVTDRGPGVVGEHPRQ